MVSWFSRFVTAWDQRAHWESRTHTMTALRPVTPYMANVPYRFRFLNAVWKLLWRISWSSTNLLRIRIPKITPPTAPTSRSIIGTATRALTSPRARFCFLLALAWYCHIPSMNWSFTGAVEKTFGSSTLPLKSWTCHRYASSFCLAPHARTISADHTMMKKA